MKTVSVFGTVLALSIAGASSAAVIFDQIGGAPPIGADASASQIFEAANSAFNIATLDDFSVSGGVGQLTSVDVVMRGYNGFTSIANVTSYTVSIYSSVAAAGANLTGDAGSAAVALASATVTDLGGLNYLISLDVSGSGINLADGTYWVAVMASLPFSGGGQLGVSNSLINNGPGANPNAAQANPGGGFGFGPTQTIAGPVNAAYRINAIPAPGAMALIGLAGLAGLRRRR